MELDGSMYQQTNNVINSIGYDNSYGPVRVLDRLKQLADQFSDDKRTSILEKQDYYNIATDLSDIRTTVDTMSRVNGKGQEDDLSSKANADLAAYLKEQNIDEISLSTLLENFFNTWNKIFLEFLTIFQSPLRSKEWYDQLRELLLVLFTILTQEDRLIYVGIGLLVASFFVYFILVTR